MPNPELTNYVNQCKAQGQTTDNIRKTLLDQGWDVKSVDDALGKKGNSALIIVIVLVLIIPVFLVIVGGIAYFGVLSPKTLIPEKCTFPLQISCYDHRVNSTGIFVSFQNGAGRDMTIEKGEFTGKGITGPCIFNEELKVAKGGRFDVQANNCNIQAIAASGATSESGKTKIDVKLTYHWDDSPTVGRVIQGELYTLVG